MIEDILKGKAEVVVTKPAELAPSGGPMDDLRRPSRCPGSYPFAQKNSLGNLRQGFTPPVG